MPRPNRDRTGRGGFTLVELGIVVLIIGIMVAAAAPRFADSLVYYRAEAAAKRIEADLKLARKQAITSSSTQAVDFVTGSNRYILTGMEHHDHPSLEYQVLLSEAPYHASLESADFGGTSNVAFDGYGVPGSGGTVIVQSGQYQKTITLNADTGKPTVE